MKKRTLPTLFLSGLLVTTLVTPYASAETSITPDGASTSLGPVDVNVGSDGTAGVSTGSGNLAFDINYNDGKINIDVSESNTSLGLNGEIKFEENGNIQFDIKPNIEPTHNVTDAELYGNASPEVLSITKPVIDAMLGQAEMGYRIYYTLSVARLEFATKLAIALQSMGLPVATSVVFAEQSATTLIDELTRLSMLHWKENVMKGMNAYANDLQEIIEQGGVPKVDTTSPYSTALSVSANAFGKVNQLFSYAEELNERARLELEQARLDFKLSEEARAAAYEALKIQRESVDKNYATAVFLLKSAAVYGGVFLDSSLIQIELVKDPTKKDELMALWIPLREKEDVKLLREDPEYVRAVMSLDQAKAFGHKIYFDGAQTAIALIKNDELRTELENEWNVAWEVVREVEEEKLLREDPVYVRAVMSLDQAKTFGHKIYFDGAKEKIALVENDKLRTELENEWNVAWEVIREVEEEKFLREDPNYRRALTSLNYAETTKRQTFIDLAQLSINKVTIEQLKNELQERFDRLFKTL